MNSSALVKTIHQYCAAINREVRLMEVCGTHTMAAFRTGLRSLFPPGLTLVAGPGCPVCVTPNDYLDRAIAIAEQPGVIVTTFGDMLRVPGSRTSLEIVRARGADVRVIYSPLDAIKLAREFPQRNIVFCGVGFETTTPAVAWTILEAARCGLTNYSVLCGHKTVPQALKALVDGELGIDGFICPGHVSVIIGSKPYECISRDYKIPCVIAGFEGIDMLSAIAMLLKQISDGKSLVENAYGRSVDAQGNPSALAAMNDVFEPCDAAWRGIGIIPGSGLSIRTKYCAHDAGKVFADIEVEPSHDQPGCICGSILKGLRVPYDCPLFNKVCTPENPVGACMVSSEGTCAAYYKYARIKQ